MVRLEEVTVILPTKNEADNIVSFLDSVPAKVRLIVVDASTDGTRQIILDHRPDHTRVLADPGNIPRARQIGSDHAETEWLLYTDADVSFSPSYWDVLRELPEHLGGICGAKRSVDAYRRYYQWFVRGQRMATFVGIPAATGSNMLVSRKAFLDTGGFNLRLSCNEDSELMWRVRRAGHTVWMIPELEVFELNHRRLEKGAMRKTMHTLGRCVALWLGILPARLQERDWGYWGTGAQTRRRARRRHDRARLRPGR